MSKMFVPKMPKMAAPATPAEKEGFKGLLTRGKVGRTILAGATNVQDDPLNKKKTLLGG